MKKKTSNRSSARSGSKSKRPVRKAAKKMMAKAGLSKSAVKKKVVKKLKRVGVAMARAAVDELLPAGEQGTPGGGQPSQGGSRGRGAKRAGRQLPQ
ncbi:MAG TPA: hypothetical protein VFF65_00355 [Phycisphaerales bacterium]|nr:hypothetical protein [Phycisphaerales bacterium]